MALVLKDRVLEDSTSSGTGSFTLSGAQAGFQAFTAIGNGNTTYYTIQGKDSSGNLTGEWEVGVGTYNANVLTRDTVLESSNGGSLVNFAIGLKDVFCDLPSEKVLTPTGTSSQLLANDGSNGLANVTIGSGLTYAGGTLSAPGGSNVTSVTATAPVVSSGGTTPDISMHVADSTHDGYLSSSDWSTFNGKAPATSGTSILYGNGSGGFSNVTVGTGLTFAGGTLDATGGSGDVVGPASATDNALVRFDTTTGKLIQNSVATLTDAGILSTDKELVGSNANFTDFPNAQAVFSQANTGSAHIYNMGIAGEGVATDIVGAGQWGVGVYGTGATAGATRGIGVVGDGHVGNTADTAAAIGVRGYATNTHSGGQNIGLYSQATGGASNYSLFMASGNIYSAVTQTWAVPDNETSALSIDATGKAGILKIVTTDGAEGVSTSGFLTVTGTTTLDTSLTGLAKLTSGVVSTATSGTDYAPATSGTAILYGNGSGGFSNVTVGSGLSFSTGTLSATGGSMVYPSAGIAVSTGSAWTTSLTAPSGAIVGTTDTQTLTNKRVTSRVTSVASSTTITPAGDSCDQYNVTAQAAPATIAAPSGTPTDGQKLTIRLTDNGTSRALTWTTSSGGYRVIGTTLPTTTTATKTIYVGCVYNSSATYWDVVAVATQA